MVQIAIKIATIPVGPIHDYDHRRTGRFFRGGAESILPEKSGAIWQFFGPKNCQIAKKNRFARPWGAAAPPAHTPLTMTHELVG